MKQIYLAKDEGPRLDEPWKQKKRFKIDNCDIQMLDTVDYCIFDVPQIWCVGLDALTNVDIH